MTTPSSLEELREKIDCITGACHHIYGVPEDDKACLYVHNDVGTNKQSEQLMSLYRSHMEAVMEHVIKNSGATVTLDADNIDIVVETVERLKKDERRLVKSYLEGEK